MVFDHVGKKYLDLLMMYRTANSLFTVRYFTIWFYFYHPNLFEGIIVLTSQVVKNKMQKYTRVGTK